MKTIKDIYQYALGAVVIIGFFILMGALLKVRIPEENKDVFYIVVGALVGSFTTIVGYFFGSSKGSAEKTDVINKQTKEIKGLINTPGS